MLRYAKSLQSCPDSVWPRRRQPPGSPVPGIFQARTLEWVAISFPSALKWKVKAKSLSHVRLLVTPWTATYQAPPSMGFSRQGYWSGEISMRNTNNLTYADVTTLMAESEEELNSLLIKVKKQSEKAGLKLNIQKMKIMASSPISSWHPVPLKWSCSVMSGSLRPHGQ